MTNQEAFEYIQQNAPDQFEVLMGLPTPEQQAQVLSKMKLKLESQMQQSQPVNKGIPVVTSPIKSNVTNQPQMQSGTDVDSMINSASQKYGVSPQRIKSMMKTESNFDQNAKSNKGASGLMQLMPNTAKMLGVTDIFDPAQNIDAGVKYYASLLKQYGGDESLALAAYNAGPGNVKKYGGIPPFKETAQYLGKILGKYPNGFTKDTAGKSFLGGQLDGDQGSLEYGSKSFNKDEMMKKFLDRLQPSKKQKTLNKVDAIASAIGQIGAYFGKEPGLQQLIASQYDNRSQQRDAKEVALNKIIADYIAPSKTAMIKEFEYGKSLPENQSRDFFDMLRQKQDPMKQIMANMFLRGQNGY